MADIFYFAITEEEKNNLKEIYYPKTAKFQYKGIHKSLESLRSFIKKEFGNKEFYYIKLNKHEININTDIISNDPDMITIELPLRINLKKKKIYPLFNSNSNSILNWW